MFCKQCGNELKESNKITGFFYKNISEQKLNIKRAGGRIIDKKAKVIAISGLLLSIIQSHISPYHIERFDNERISAFGFWFLDKNPSVGNVAMTDVAGSAFFKILYFAFIVLSWFAIVMGLLNFTNYREPFKKFWIGITCGYWCRTLLNVIYYFNIRNGMSYVSNKLSVFDLDLDDYGGAGMNHFNTVIMIICIAACVYTTVACSIYEKKKKLSKSRINIYADINDKETALQPSEFSSEIFIDNSTGELYQKCITYVERASDNARFDIIK